jgi:Putative peptidoglycan binding domain
VERAGLAKEQLQTDVELRLRKAGIRVYTHEELLRAQGQPYLYINAGVLLHSDGWVSYGITVELRQRASLDINAVSATVTTWSTGGFGKAGILRLHTLRDTVRDFVDQFINAYLSVSPRPAGSAAPSSPSPRPDLVRQVQERLLIVGYNPGTLDGTLGPQTRDALRWFQNAKGLKTTGDLDDPTLNALGIR